MAIDYEALIEPVKTKRNFEEVSEKLKELIFDGTLGPGQRLPSETALAQLFHVGRQSVREALRVLELSGFITVKSGVKGGAVVEGTMLSRLSVLFLETFKLNKISLEDCIEARKTVETSVLDLVSKNARKEDFEALRGSILTARENLSLNKPAFQEHIHFHRLLAQTSKNYTLTVVVEIILAVYSDFTSGYGMLSLKESRQIADLHEGIVNALEAKEKREAVTLLKKDLAVAEKGLRVRASSINRMQGRRSKV
jgi:GntR family transcriptional regulator, transcriptional repressor for pyruvate dehydrogenase complex